MNLRQTDLILSILIAITTNNFQITQEHIDTLDDVKDDEERASKKLIRLLLAFSFPPLADLNAVHLLFSSRRPAAGSSVGEMRRHHSRGSHQGGRGRHQWRERWGGTKEGEGKVAAREGEKGERMTTQWRHRQWGPPSRGTKDASVFGRVRTRPNVRMGRAKSKRPSWARPSKGEDGPRVRNRKWVSARNRF